MKKCSGCKETKHRSEFAPNKSKKDGLNSRCRDCHNAYMRDWYAKNSEKHKARVSLSVTARRGRKYGLTVDEVEELFKNNPLCQICEKRPATAIDHCHESGKVRGVLCAGCNTGLGKLGDSVEGLERAIAYLRR